ncbi:MAG: thiamine pyrophosphate-dependent enzyme [Pirellulales bacterium]
MGTNAPAMPLISALEALRDVRGDRAVITSMGSAREWPRISQHPLDFHYIPSTMGGVIPLGVGLALARPEREFVVLCGDGSLLMNLGTLVTVAASGAANLAIVLLNNSVYEVTGGQATAGASANVDFGRVAEDCGIRTVRAFDDADIWRAEAAATLGLAGPRFIELSVAAVTDDYRLESPGAVGPRLAAFRQALAASATSGGGG